MNPCDNCNCDNPNDCPFADAFEDSDLTTEIDVDTMTVMGLEYDDYNGYAREEDN